MSLTGLAQHLLTLAGISTTSSPPLHYPRTPWANTTTALLPPMLDTAVDRRLLGFMASLLNSVAACLNTIMTLTSKAGSTPPRR